MRKTATLFFGLILFSGCALNSIQVDQSDSTLGIYSGYHFDQVAILNPSMLNHLVIVDSHPRHINYRDDVVNVIGFKDDRIWDRQVASRQWNGEPVDTIIILPPIAQTTMATQEMNLLVLGYCRGQAYDMTSRCRFSIDDPAIANITNAGVLTPKRPGQTLVRVVMPVSGRLQQERILVVIMPLHSL